MKDKWLQMFFMHLITGELQLSFSTVGKVIRKFNIELMNQVPLNLAKRIEGGNHIEDVND